MIASCSVQFGAAAAPLCENPGKTCSNAIMTDGGIVKTKIEAKHNKTRQNREKDKLRLITAYCISA